MLSGLAVWKPVQLWWLSNLLGGFVMSRYVDFFVMAGIVGFLYIHLALVPKVLPLMITGGRLHGKRLQGGDRIHRMKS